jgi:hypothetical protein
MADTKYYFSAIENSINFKTHVKTAISHVTIQLKQQVCKASKSISNSIF